MRGRLAVATVAVAGLECAWLFMLLHTVGRGLHLAVFVPWLIVIYVSAFVVGTGLRAWGRSGRTAQVVSWLVWPLATLALLVLLLHSEVSGAGSPWTAPIVKAAVFIVFSAAVVWWLGGRLASRRPDYAVVLFEFQFGLMMLIISFFIGYQLGLDQSAAVPVSVAFVGFGLVGAAAARSGEEGGSAFAGRGRTWWGMLTISIMLVLAFGLLAGVLFAPEMIHLLGRGLRAAWGLIDRLFAAIASLFPSSGSETPGLTQVPSTDVPGLSSGLPDKPLPHSSAMSVVYGILVCCLVLAAVWSLASQVFGWLRHRGRDNSVQIESLPGAFRLDIALLLRRLLAWLVRVLSLGRLRRKPHEEPPRMTAVRRLYADMLRWGAESGFPRGSSQTPCEYQQILCMELPGYQAEVALITETFVRARYGAQMPTDAELHQVSDSRHRLKAQRSARGRH